MTVCEICCKDFGQNWRLQRHLSKKRPCRPCAGNGPPTGRIDPPTGLKRCQWCGVGFKAHLNRHVSVCKLRDDLIRVLEIQLGIPLPPETPKHSCRFCGHQSTKASHATRHLATCKHRSEYLASLQKRASRNPSRTHRPSVVNNTTTNNTNTNTNSNNNTTNNTVNINCLGSENLSYITEEVVKRLMQVSRSDEEAFASIVKMIHADPHHPENHNIVYTNAKSTLVLVKKGPSFEYAHIDDVTGEVTTKTLDQH